MFITTNSLFPVMLPVDDIKRLQWCGLSDDEWDVTFRDDTVERHSISPVEIARLAGR
jgi:hypothetical protein